MSRYGQVPRRDNASRDSAATKLQARHDAAKQAYRQRVDDLIASATACEGCDLPVIRARGHSGYEFVLNPQPSMKALHIVATGLNDHLVIENRGGDRQTEGFFPHVCTKSNVMAQETDGHREADTGNHSGQDWAGHRQTGP